jgi:hypothetical protein
VSGASSAASGVTKSMEGSTFRAQFAGVTPSVETI